jgi:rubrerythrin
MKTEMQKTSDEMKKLSDEMKAQVDVANAAEKSSGSRASPESSPQAAVYTCPMHPEVKQPAPGKCPKCGMTLVKKSGAP